MSYINNRIRGSVRRYRTRGMSGLGGPSDCGAGQIWDANFVFPGLPPGQCVTQAQSDANKAAHPEQYGPQQDTSLTSDITSIAGAVSKIFGTQQPAAPTVVSTGPDTMTLVALGGAALLGIYLLTR